MSRVFQTELNTNLHPSFFEFKNVPPQEKRTVESVEKGEPLWSKDQKHFKQHKLHDEVSRKNYASKVLNGIQEVSLFSLLFFSQENVQELQRLIRYNVYVNTDKKYIIGKQSETELVIIMRGIYLQYSSIPSNKSEFTKEIKKLNSMVVTTVLPDLISNIEQYKGYLKDNGQVAKPIERAENPSIKGENVLRSVSDVLVGDDNFFAASSSE